MKKQTTFDKEAEVFHVTMEIPLWMTGNYTYMFDDELGPEWKQHAVCVFVNRKWGEYSLNETIYLDYKDSSQTGRAILFFENEDEAVEFGKKHNLMVEFIDND